MYRKLDAWKKAYKFGLDIYEVTANFPKEELFGITSQMRRAATSIAANLAEGSTRNSKKEFKQFLSIARGSASEVETWLAFSKDLGYLPDDKFKKLADQIDDVKALLFRLMKSISS